MRGSLCTTSMLSTLQISPLLGRSFQRNDEHYGSAPVALLSHRSWRRLFSSNRSVVGTELSIAGQNLTIVGVLPPGFTGMEVGESIDLWIPLSPHTVAIQRPNLLSDESIWWLNFWARLKTGETIESAQAALRVFWNHRLLALQNSKKEFYRWEEAEQEALILERGTRGRSRVRTEFADSLFALNGAALTMLTIAMVNLAAFIFAHTFRRRNRFHTMEYLGASSIHLFKYVSREISVASIIATVFAVISSVWFSNSLVSLAILPPDVVEMNSENRRIMIIVTMTLCLFITLLVVAESIAIASAIGPSSQTNLLGKRPNLSTPILVFFLIVQVSLSVIFLTSSLVLKRSLTVLYSRSLGVDTDKLVQIEFLRSPTDAENTRQHEAIHMLERAVGTIPGVMSVSFTQVGLIRAGESTRRFELEGASIMTETFEHADVVGPRFFQNLRASVIAGRDFTIDDRHSSTPVMIINRSLERAYFEDSEALGARVGGRTVVGVVEDVRHHGPARRALGRFYVPHYQLPKDPFPIFRLVVRLDSRAVGFSASVDDVIESGLMPFQVLDVTAVRDLIDRQLRVDRLLSWVTMFFADMSMLVATLGCFSLVWFVVVSRRKEIGIHLAVGGSQLMVVWRVVRRVISCVVVGGIVGVAIAMVVVGVLRSILAHIGPLDVSLVILGFVIPIVVVVLSALIPSVLGTNIDVATLVKRVP